MDLGSVTLFGQSAARNVWKRDWMSESDHAERRWQSVCLLASDAAAAAAIDGADEVMRCASAVCSPFNYYDQLTVCDRYCDRADR